MLTITATNHRFLQVSNVSSKTNNSIIPIQLQLKLQLKSRSVHYVHYVHYVQYVHYDQLDHYVQYYSISSVQIFIIFNLNYF